MTITEEQLKADREHLRWCAQHVPPNATINQFIKLLWSYISEVERLRAEIRKMSPSYMPDSVIAPRTKLKEQIEKLQAENAELKEAARKVVDLRDSLTGAPIAIEELRRLIVK